MSKRVIIFGAGASNDYIDPQNIDFGRLGGRTNFKPPLANKIFDTTKFGTIMDSYPEMKGLVANTLAALKNGRSLEDYLLQIKKISEKNDIRAVQLLALEFYLQDLFKKVSIHYGNQHGNNYDSILGELFDKQEDCTVVTFNYDLLFEQSLSSYQKLGDIRDYIKGKIKLIKLHGSCNWVYPFNDYSDESFMNEENKNAKEYLLSYPNAIKKYLIIKRDILIKEEYDQNGHHYVPAIAIPLNEKDNFVCPQNHIDVLLSNLKDAEKILIIGWKAADKKLIELLKSAINNPVGVTIVSKTIEGADQVKSNLSEISMLNFKLVPNGFTEFVGSQPWQEFFN